MARAVERVVLGAAALVLLAVGVGGLAAPEAFYASYGIAVGDVDLASELRGIGAALVLAGLATGGGVVSGRWAFTSAVIGSAVLLGFALGRVVSVMADGIPASTILAAGALEAVLGAATLWAAIRGRPRSARASAEESARSSAV